MYACKLVLESVVPTQIVTSKNGIPIRLTDERWAHISKGHGELAAMWRQMLDTLSNPARIFRGHHGELLAVREVEVGKWLVVVYREFEADGFVIAGFLTRRISSVEKRRQVWP